MEQPIFDDGGSGLFDACVARFGDRGYSVTCDSRHAVWVKNADGSFAVGLAPWLRDMQSMERILEGVEAKMRKAGVAAKA